MLRIATLISALAILTFGSAAASAPVMFKRDPALSGVIAAPSPAAITGIRFTFRTGGPVRGTPALSDGVLYFGSADGNFYAVDAATGAEHWHVRAGLVDSSPAIVDGVVFFTTRAHLLVALAADTGRPLWQFDLGADRGTMNYWDFYSSSPIPFGDVLYVGSGDGNVYAVDRATGHEVWHFQTGARVRATPAVTDAVVIAATMGGKVFAIDRRTGKRRWMFATKGATNTFALKDNDTTAISGSPAVGNGIVLIGGRDAFLYGIDLATGKQRWRITHNGDSWILSSAIEGDTFYAGSGSATILQAGDLQTGAEHWRVKSTGAIFGAPAVAGSVVLFEDFGGKLHALDKTSGAALWSFPLGDRAISTPVVGPDGTVYAASDAGILYALATIATPAPAETVNKYVHLHGIAPGAGYFQSGVDQVLAEYFKNAGYQAIDDAKLHALLADPAASHSVIVFADNYVPPQEFASKDASAPFRKYLDAGGRAVFLGLDPIVFAYDAKTGDLTGYDFDVPQRVLDIAMTPRTADWGYHISEPTEDGRSWGLRGTFVSNGAAEESHGDVILARDEFGGVTSFARPYANGGLLIQLQVPRNVTADYLQYRQVIEHGL